jgi:hypothetical protein
MLSFKEFLFLSEMTQNMGSPTTDLEFGDNKKSWFQLSKDHEIIHSGNSGLKLHKFSDKDHTYLSTNDHENQETLHRAIFQKFKKSKQIPVDHIKQMVVEKVKNKTPKEYATKTSYDHWKSQNHPLVTSDTQYKTGHESWKKLLHWALVDGHHVYYHDGEQLHKSTKENVDQHHKSSFGKYGDASEDTKHKKMIISKDPLS